MVVDVQRFIRDITKPMYVWRMASADTAKHREKSALKRIDNAAREIQRVIAVHTDTAAYDGSNGTPRRELTARERDVVCRVLTDVIQVARRAARGEHVSFDCVSVRVGEPDFIEIIREVRAVIDPREG